MTLTNVNSDRGLHMLEGDSLSRSSEPAQIYITH